MVGGGIAISEPRNFLTFLMGRAFEYCFVGGNVARKRLISFIKRYGKVISKNVGIIT